MKILIADDEELVRENLRDILRGLAQGNSIFEAVNGRRLIETAAEVKPDICFVDIRMPGISGLDAIEVLIGDFPEISWIILSGYSDFDYARKALSLGVSDYLLKPATESEVEAALAKAAEKRLDAGRLKREKFEYRVGGVLNNSSAEEFDEFLKGLGRWAAVVAVPAVDSRKKSAELQRRLARRLRESLDRNPPHDYAGAFNLPDGFPAVIAAGNNPLELLHELKSLEPEVFKLAENLVYSSDFSSLEELSTFFEKSPELNGTGIDAAELFSAGESSDRCSHIVRQAEKLVLEQYSEPIGVAQIADQLNVTPNYLSSLFKKYKSVPFTKFITDIRLGKAPELIQTPGLTVKEASRRLGYLSSRHFTKLFRERYGMPPTAYISRKS